MSDSYEMSRGAHHGPPRAINREGNHADAEQEYDRLRDLASTEARKRGECFERSKEAYNRGDGAAAKALSNEGKAHGAKMADYNRQASEFIFRENNANGRAEGDTIDLHGQHEAEVEEILEKRVRAAQASGQEHLHVIVGKGNHSVGHRQVVKPRVEELLRQWGLKFRTEENEGRIYVNLQGGEPLPPQQGGGGYGGHQQQQHGGQQQHHGGQQQQQHHQQQQQDDGAKLLKWLFRKLRRLLCS